MEADEEKLDSGDNKDEDKDEDEDEEDPIEIAKKMVKKDGEKFKIKVDRKLQPIHNYLERKQIRNYLEFLDNIISLHKDFKLALFSLMCPKWEDKTGILDGKNEEVSQKLRDIWGG
jgi:hypothetical protein